MSGLKRKRDDPFIQPPRLSDQVLFKRMRIDESHDREACPAHEKEVTAKPEAQAMAGAQSQASRLEEQVDIPMSDGKEPDLGHGSTAPRSNATADNLSPTKLDQARGRIEAQLNLEILLRHEELRLIEQELAKAQVSLEQLRRCHVIPFPGTPGSTSTFDQVSDGTAPALEPRHGHTRPSHAAPWGVKDGPYAQHYARWLIPDDVFDSTTQPQAKSRHSTGGKSYTPTDVRGLRGSDRDVTVANRRQRQSVSLKANSSLTNSVQPKEKPTGPLKLKRNDGVWVKLVCRHCQKEDVNSVQGFLNHCRIAHSDTMRTHQEAAAAHGVVLDEDEIVASPNTVRHTPMSATFGNTWPTQSAQVHSLNASNRKSQTQCSFSTPTRPSPHLLTDGTCESGPAMATPMTASFQPSPARSSLYISTQQTHTTPRQHAGPAPSLHYQIQATASSQNPSFVGSSHTPSLSALAQKRGYGLDLAKLVTSARQKIDLDQVESLAGDSEDETETLPSQQNFDSIQTLHAQSNSSASRMPRQPSPLVQSVSASAFETQRPRPAVIPNSASSSFDPIHLSPAPTHLHERSAFQTPTPDSVGPTISDSQIHELSPRTAESNPGMVTDREDDPDDDDDDDQEYEEVPDSESEAGGNVHGSSQHSVRIRGDEDVEMRDVDDGDSHEAKFAPPQEHSTRSYNNNGERKRNKRGRPSKQE